MVDAGKPILYFIVVAIKPLGRQAAQLIHAMDDWASLHGSHGGPVHVHEVPTTKDLAFVLTRLGNPDPGKTVAFREPDLGDRLTAVATTIDPASVGLDLRLL